MVYIVTFAYFDYLRNYNVGTNNADPVQTVSVVTVRSGSTSSYLHCKHLKSFSYTSTANILNIGTDRSEKALQIQIRSDLIRAYTAAISSAPSGRTPNRPTGQTVFIFRNSLIRIFFPYSNVLVQEFEF